MAKGGFGKFLGFCTVTALAAAGVYYYLSRKDEDFIDDFDDDFDDFDDFEDDKTDSRNYVDLEQDSTLNKDEEETSDDTFHVDAE